MKKTFTSTLVLLSALILTACSEGNTGKDMDGTTSTYEVAFTANNKEYEYTVNAKTGEIMEKSTEN